MDISLSEGELMTIHNDFHHGHYAKALEFDDSSVSAEAKLPARILKLRAQIALGQADKVLAATKSEAGTPAIAAVRALATYASGQHDAGVAAAEKLAGDAKSREDAQVQVLAGTVLAAGGRTEAATALLSAHDGSLEALAVLVQVHLAGGRTDLAAREIAAARKWAQDSTLFNVAGAWVDVRVGGDRYQQAFYEFEDMPVPQAIAELHLGRLPEAEAALAKRLADQAGDADAMANSVVLHTLAGKPAEADEMKRQLAAARPDHPLLLDLEAKSDLFDEAASKFTAKVAS